MEKIICENCGQEYNASFEACPLCGHVNEQVGVETAETQTAETPAEPEYAPRQRAQDTNRIPTWLIAAICVVLGLAIIMGAIYIVSSAGLFKAKEPETLADPVAVTAPEDASPAPEALPENVNAPVSPASESQLPSQSSTTQPEPAEAPQEPEPSELQPVETEQPEEPEEPAEGEEEPQESAEPAEIDADLPDETGAETTEPAADPSVQCDAISLDKTDITLSFRGETFRFHPTVTPASAADSIVWTSSNESMVTVDETGLINARTGTGTDYVLITAACGDKKASCIVRCSFETADELLSLSSEDVTFFYSGETAQLEVTDELTASQRALLEWSTSDPSVAAVDPSGKVTAMSGGTAEIRATLGERSGSCIVRCSFGGSTTDSATGEGGSGYGLSYSDVTLFFPGEHFTLSVTGEGEIPAHTWSTSDASVCTVDTDGVVTAVGSGTATVVTTVNGQLMQCVVRVSND